MDQGLLFGSGMQGTFVYPGGGEVVAQERATPANTPMRREMTRQKSIRDRLLDLMIDGKHRTLYELQEATGGGPTGVSAKMRELRTPKHGGHNVQSHIEDGVWKYWIEI